jgi:hypothetical protein
MACWFRQDDVNRFDPADRYITGAALIERWSKHPAIQPEAYIRAKIAESRLLDIHPTFGGTRGIHDDDTDLPPLSAGLFAMNHIVRVEAEDELDVATASPNSGAVLEVVLPVGVSPDSPSVPFGDPCAAFRLLQELHTPAKFPSPSLAILPNRVVRKQHARNICARRDATNVPGRVWFGRSTRGIVEPAGSRFDRPCAWEKVLPQRREELRDHEAATR